MMSRWLLALAVLFGGHALAADAPNVAPGIVAPANTNGCGNQPCFVTGTSPVVSSTAENNHVLKATAGTLISAYASNGTATAGWLMVFNLTAKPADGAVTPIDCVALPASGTVAINYPIGAGKVYSTAITVVLSSNASCLTLTTGVITGFISGSVL